MVLFEPEDGVVESCTCPPGKTVLAERLASLDCKIAQIVYESDPTGFAFARALERAVSVIAASRILRGYAATARTDRIVAVRPENCFARELFCLIALPTVEQEGNRAFVRRRKRVAEGWGKIKQEIKRFLFPDFRYVIHVRYQKRHYTVHFGPMFGYSLKRWFASAFGPAGFAHPFRRHLEVRLVSGQANAF